MMPRGSFGAGAFGRAGDAARLVGMLADASERPVEIATAPKDEVWRDGKVSLHRYRPLTAPAHLGPLLILQGLFGRQTITDLEPERSLVRRLLNGGTDLFVLDWGTPTRADMCLDMTDFAEHWLGDALAAIRTVTGRRAAMLGICQGGVFALCHAARHPQAVAGLVPAVTPVDFHADQTDPNPGHGLLNLWVRSLGPEAIGAFLDEMGMLPGSRTSAVFQALTPARTAAKYSTELAELAADRAELDTFLRMERWLADRPDQPGAAARQWLIDLYCENRLIDGRFMVAGEPVALGRITCPVLAIYGRDDHIVPAACAAALEGRTASAAYAALEVPAGHIGVFVSRRAQAIVPPSILKWLESLDHRA